MADKKHSKRSRLLDNVQDLEPSEAKAVLMDPPADPVSEKGESGELSGPADAWLPRSPLANRRYIHLTMRHLVLSILTSLIIGCAVFYLAWHFMVREMDARMGTPTARPAPAPASSTGDEEALAQAAGQIAALQKQLDVLRREQLITQQNTRESLERISDVLNNPKLAPEPATPVVGLSGESRIADAAPAVTPTQAEFIQLKERNRLTQYADEAIATGMREPLEALVEAMVDPDSKQLQEAAKAEYLRVVRSIEFIPRDDPGYRLPVTELFKDKGIREEADVNAEALLGLLADHKQPWQVRVRVCFLLLSSEASETNAKLIQAIKEDPSLEVAKHAQIALEQRIKRRFRIFDIPAIDAWWQSQGR
jgi:hypothetical protein